MHDIDVIFKRSLVATMTALYISAPLYAAPGTTSVDGSSFKVPTFTAADVHQLNKSREANKAGNIFIGGSGLANRQVTHARSGSVFKADKNISGVQKFIVQLESAPVATYDGSLSGYAATKAPKANLLVTTKGLSTANKTVQKYQQFLLNSQQKVVSLAKSAGANLELKKQYTLATNAMLVEMTQDDAEILAMQPGIKKITLHRILPLRTDRGPVFIGADKLWTASGIHKPMPVQGEGMVVGIIDTGINTDHPAFSGEGYTNPRAGFIGDCETEPSLCNNKLIGVRSYPEITDVYNAQEFQDDPWSLPEWIRPANGEDYNGHGSHTASTAAGNYLENTPLQGADGNPVSDGVDLPFQFPSTSGVAPKAHIISYQVCWPGSGGDPYAGCPEAAILSAFEDAITDGVDTINFSIGGSEGFPWDDPMELAFLAAREAGISVAAAAGNSGPSFWSADHTSPWVTTVGASTHDRVLSAGNKTLDAFEGTPDYLRPWSTISGKSFSGSITGQVVLAEQYPDPNPSDDYSAASCNVPFPAGTFTADQIVLCERGDINRTTKADNVKAGGAGGFILQNVSYDIDNIAADVYSLPGIHVSVQDRWSLYNWVSGSNGTARATISEYTNSYALDETAGNNLAEFSSMGPSRTNNTLVPDLTAPGVNIYAANADDQPFTAAPNASDWTMMSGTSMASPHVAGAMTLLQQLHPTWTPAEIQSALMMTAKPVWLNFYGDLVEPYYNFMAGAGALDVATAANAGLIMDESIENYKNANPENGGLANWLNLPSMVEMNCEASCSWLRTVKATRDGQWSVEGIGKELDVVIDVSPRQFQLKAGQTQTIIVKATLPNIAEYKINPEEPGAPWEALSNNNMPFNGKVVFTEQSGASPQAHWPIVAMNVRRQLPVSHSIEFNRDQGSETLDVNTDHFSQFTPRVFGPIKPTTYASTLRPVSPFLFLENIQVGWNIKSIEVPAATKRLMVDIHSAKSQSTKENLNPRYTKLMPYVIVGRDSNGNGTFVPSEAEMAENPSALQDEYRSEVLCVSSSSAESNYCSLMDPKAGTYWMATVYVGDGSDQVPADVVTGHTLIGSTTDQKTVTVSGPDSHDGNGNYPIKITWDLPKSVEGERYYGAFDLGNKPGAEGTLGMTALNLTRGVNTLTWSVDKTQARVMDKVKFNVKIQPNLESDNRDYAVELKLPKGMRLVPSTLTTNNEAIASAISVTEQGFKLSGEQQSTRHIQRNYAMTTNKDDALCRTPQIDEHSDGKYIDLAGDFGIQPNADWLTGDAYVNYDVPIDWLFYNQNAQFKLYNQENAGYMRLHTVGALQFNTAYWMMDYHRGPGFLFEALAPFWRGSFEMKFRPHWEDPWGLTLANQYAEERPDLGDLVFMEFDNVTDSYTNEEFDFEVILRSGIDDFKGKFEIIYAYDNLGADVASGVVMVEGFDSAFSHGAGPKNGMLSTVLGFDDLDTKLNNDTVVCFDYEGPEQSQIDVSFTAVIQPEATGNQLPIELAYSMDGQPDAKEAQTVAVKGNIQLAAIADMSVAENGKIENISILYVDANKVPNVVEVSGAHVTAQVEGDKFSLTPKADFHGETTVTVTVRDTEHSGDSASVSFRLSVGSDGIEKGCMDSKALNYNAVANKDDGSCKYPVAVAPAVTASKSGGSFGFFIFGLIVVLGWRRRFA